MKENPDISHTALMKQHSMADHERSNDSAVIAVTGNLENRRKSHPFIYSDKSENGTLMFCYNCHHIVNGQSEDDHTNHETVKVKEAAMIYKVRLSAAVLKVRGLIRYSHIVIKDLESYLEKIAACMAELTAEVLKRASLIPAEADIVVQAVIGDIQNEHQSENDRIREKLQEFEKFVGSAKGIAIKCDHLSNVKDDRTVLTEGRKQLTYVLSLEKSLPVCPVERSLYMLTPVIQPPEGQELPPERLIGEFSKVLVPWRLEVKRTASFRPEAVASARFVTTMCPAENGQVWVVWQWGPLIHKVDKKGNVVKAVDAGSKVDDICTDKDGNLVVACHEAKCIKFFNSNFEVEKTISMEKVPRGLQIFSRNELVVCCVQNLHHRNGDISNVLKLRTDSDNVTSPNVNELNIADDTLIQPWRVAVNINGDVCVSDRNKGSVIIFDPQGEIKATYSGPETSTRHAFAPHGISCDNYGQIFVVDYTNHTVHVLDSLGRFRGFLIMDSELEKKAIFMGTSSPFSITIDSEGDIWVGNKFGYLTVLKYQP